MPRPRLLEPRRRVNVYIREDLLARFSLLHYDPSKDRVSFGDLSEFVNDALAKHIMEVEEVQKQ